MESVSSFQERYPPEAILQIGALLDTQVFNVEKGYNLVADYYDDWKWQSIWGRVEWPHIDRILTEIVMESGRFSSILDVGVGTGTYLQNVISKFNVFNGCGVDISGRMLDLAGSKLQERATLNIGDARKLKFSDNSFDVVLLCRVASHLDDIRVAALEISRVLRPGGVLIISDLDPCHPYQFTRIPFGSAKIYIETYKHSISEWSSVFCQLGFHAVYKHVIWSESVQKLGIIDLPSTISQSPNHPLSYVLCARK